MAQNFLTNINLTDNELQNFRVHNTATAPTGNPGEMYFDSGTALMKYHNGTAWVIFGTSGSGVTSVDVSGGTTGLTTSGGPITSTGTITLAGTLNVANGGTGVSTASITAFNNITGYTASGATGTTSTNLVFSTSPTLITPILGTPQSVTLTNATGTAANLTAGLATNVVGGLGGQVHYQSAVNTTAFLANGTAGQILQANGTTLAPSWISTTSITGLGTVTSGVWNAGVISGQYGGTGVANTGKTITLGGNLTTSGAFASTFTMTNATNVTFPTSGTLATTTDITNAIQGVKWKDSVRVATTTAGTLATSFANGQVIDAITLVTGDRILIKDQASAIENGIYTVNASGAPTRATDADVTAEVIQMVTFAQEGTTNADRGFVMTAASTFILGTNNMTFSDFASSSVPDATTVIKGKVELAIQAETEARSSSTVVVTPNTLANFPVKQTFGCSAHSANVSTTVCTHNYGHRDVIVQIRKSASPYNQVFADIAYTSTTTLTVTMNGAISAGEYVIITLG